jgi:hypothetical protein
VNYNDKNFENELCVSYNTDLQRALYDIGLAAVPFEVQTWLEEHIGKDNFIFGFEDYGQHGEWMLYTRSSADLLAFKLRWCDR